MTVKTRVLAWSVLGGLVAGFGPARADLLDPSAFATLGAFPTNTGPTAETFTVNTDPNGSGKPTLTGPGTSITGVYASSGGTTIAVFTFNSVTIGEDFVLTVVGGRPFALLSKTDLTLSGAGSVPGIVESTGRSAAPGAGGGVGGGLDGSGTGSGAGGGGTGSGGGGGGGFGGLGGIGHPTGSGGASGSTYGSSLSLGSTLQGGSGGGGSAIALGGGGGGAIELGALGTLSILGNALVSVEGGFGLEGNGTTGGGGGGSGGGVFLHAPTVDVAGFISAVGGGAGAGGGAASAGGGGGGRVLILSDGGSVNLGGVNVAGMNGGAGGSIAQGTLPVPEPSSLVLLALGLIGAGRLFQTRRRSSGC